MIIVRLFLSLKFKMKIAMRRFTHLLIFGVVLMTTACSSSNNDKPKTSKKSKEQKEEPIVATAKINFVDDNRKEDFKGQKANQFSPSPKDDVVADVTEVEGTWAMRIIFKDKTTKTDIAIILGRHEGSTATFKAGTYDGNNKDFFIMYQVYAGKDIYNSQPNMEHALYKDENIINNAVLTIDKITETEIEGSFSFDGYTLLSRPIKKMEIKEGQFKGVLVAY